MDRIYKYMPHEPVHKRKVVMWYFCRLSFTNLVPNLFRGIQGVSEKRVDSCVRHQYVNATVLLKSLKDTKITR